MRCPKCGYISFDHLEKCRKCNKDIEAISEGLFGSTYNIHPPTFLHLRAELKEGSSEQGDLLNEQSIDDVDDYVDEDLEILMDEEESDVEEEIEFAEDKRADSQSLEDDEQDDEEIEIDFSKFEDADEPEVNLFDETEMEEEAGQEQVAHKSMAIEIPDELADITDLAPPAMDSEQDEQPAGRPADTVSDDLSLDDLDFDLGLDGLDEGQTKSPGIPEEALLALDEIDFTETLTESRSGKPKKTGKADMDMDMDLDFDLDLGGLSIHKDV
jgi:hypothetical protein